MSEARTKRAGDDRADDETLKKFEEWDKRPKPPPVSAEGIEAAQTSAFQDINAILETATKDSADAAAKLADLRNTEYFYYLQCRYHDKGRSDVGIYFARLPGEGEVLGMTDWCASYKPKFNELYTGEIICDECYKKGIDRSLEVEPVGRRGQFKIPERMLWRVPRDPKRLMAEGATRARAGRSPSSNQGREDAMNRSVAVGLEKIQ